MATLYFVCGGPCDDDSILDELFGPSRLYLGESVGLFDFCNTDDGRIGYVVTNGYWTFSGDSDEVFRLHAAIAERLSMNGRSRALFGQTTAGYYEIVDYRGGLEVSRILDPGTDSQDRVTFVHRDLSIDDLWRAADEVLPTPTRRIFGLPANWFRIP